ncbi:hypothetical protein HOC80_01635 [archaeon]|jgi:predicted transcriptional regulator|nr:hypothetical protein [archaeon]MBT4416783.1 hypothetical protein [archaeon]
MKRVFYANLYAESLHYPMIHYIQDLKDTMKKGDKLILCIWDKRIYSFQKPEAVDFRTKQKEVINNIQAILNYYEVDYEIIFLSDAFLRLVKVDEFNELLYRILSKISVNQVENAYRSEMYLSRRPITISKLVFIVADYLISLFFKKLFPELNVKEVTNYFTGKRFKAVLEVIEESISEIGIIVSFPRVLYTNPIPILNYDSGKWISVEMSKNEVEKAIREALKDKLKLKQIKEIIHLLHYLLGDDGFYICKDDKSLNASKDELIDSFKELKKEDLIKTLTVNIYNYLGFVKDNMLTSRDDKLKKVNYIKDAKSLKSILSVLNPSKMEILKLCDGKNSIKEIIEKSPMKPSSTQSYISRLKASGIISKSNIPKRFVNEVVISFD